MVSHTFPGHKVSGDYVHRHMGSVQEVEQPETSELR